VAPFAQVLAELGSFGHFQVQLLILLSVPSFLTTFYMFTQVFMVLDEAHYCSVTCVRSQTLNLSAAEQLALGLPLDAAGSPEPCLMFQFLEYVLSHSFSETQLCEAGWAYPEGRPLSVENEVRPHHLKETSVYVAGLLTGVLTFGPLCDWIGRKATLLVPLLLFAILDMRPTFMPSFELYMVLCFSVATAGGVQPSLSLCLLPATEWVGPSWRIQAVVLAQCAFSLEQMALAGLACDIRNWRLFQIAGTAPVFLPFCFWALPESARWLLTWGRGEEAKQLIQKVALINRHKLSSQLLSQLAPEKTSPAGPTALAEVGHFGLNIYLTQLIFGAVEVPSQSGTLVLDGLTCITIIFIPLPPDLPVVVTVLALVGKFALAAGFTIFYVDSAELLPTVIRQTGMALVDIFSRIRGILMPLMILLGEHRVSLLVLIYGSLPSGASLLGPADRDTWPDPEGHCRRPGAVLSEKDLEASGSISSPG
ncbi:hypothetical protein K5549_020501, partial [Capra hircus]